ncbi:MAG: AAA family ATPase [Syntrophothermus sp.]|uniref:Lon protease family protein n=1 Tax=Syntrophothermus sp. TaxID=2736299 RepID=UPI00257FF6EA|nr:ATP-binding protein [Syntrophothermus sp.]NSW83412.1 AAA family ATPase [Syntrophothermus sp.]
MTTLSKLKPKDLRKLCDPEEFPFASTAELEPLEGIIGQERAVKSVEFGLDIKSEGYNIFLAGISGTGKVTLARNLVEKRAQQDPAPFDWCYVFNFRNPDRPRLLQLPAGKGRRLARDMDRLVNNLRKMISKAFESQHFEMHRNRILGSFLDSTNLMYQKLEKMAQAEGFTISRSQHGISTIPLRDGKPLDQEEFATLDDETKQELLERSKALQEKINEAMREYKELERTVREKMRVLEVETARSVMVPYFAALYETYRDYAKVIFYLEEVHQDVLENLELFAGQQEETQFPAALFRRIDKKAAFKRYKVNVLVDNEGRDYAPVVYETNPTYANLFGTIEYESEFGILSTDFTRVRAGAVHRANGGYLILHVTDLFKNFFVWDTLKRVLKNREITIESVLKTFSVTSSEVLEPEPMPVEVKVILIGEPLMYYLLYTYDEEFRQLFKIRADFEVEMPRTGEYVSKYAQFVSCVVRRHGLRHFTREAVARLVDYGTWLAEDQKKLTTLFDRINDIIFEADVWASREKCELVEKRHVQKAIDEKRSRSDLLEAKVLELIREGTIIIDVHGEAVGQINGLAVYSLGDYWFGKPCRITARTFMGEKGVINIEREVRMSGSIHTKGVLTLAGYLGAQYAQDKPLSLSASLTFEQTYEGIEGDSASAAELFAILSSLSGVPIRQGIAVTGSINQNGEIQPIGGVNQKIEGFFKVCKLKGLDGRQGVIIPKQNIANLMLPDEIVDAVRKGKFSIWAIGHVNEGIEILMGKPAGKREANGDFTKDSVHYQVDRQLAKWAERRTRGIGRQEQPDVLSRGRRIRPRREGK